MQTIVLGDIPGVGGWRPGRDALSSDWRGLETRPGWQGPVAWGGRGRPLRLLSLWAWSSHPASPGSGLCFSRRTADGASGAPCSLPASRSLWSQTSLLLCGLCLPGPRVVSGAPSPVRQESRDPCAAGR